MNRSIILSAILLLFTISSCTQKGKIEASILKQAKNCSSSECVITLSDLTKFEWDTVYFFHVPGSNEYISKVTGHGYAGYEEFTRATIFFNKGKLVYYENNKSGIEIISKDQVMIGGIIDSNDFNIFTPENAIFEVKFMKHNDVDYYKLKPINN